MMIEMQLRWVGVLLVSGIAAVHDARSGHIPNWLVGLGLVLGAGGSVAALALADALEALTRTGSAALGFVACGAVPLLLFRLKALGGGDVKLLATVGAQLGPLLGLELSFAAFVVAATYWPLRSLGARVFSAARRAGSEARGAPDRLAIAFAPCLFVAAVALSASHWRM
jgi:Flp pilus assembly protein protease CpaA